MNTTSLNQPQMIALGLGTLFVLVLALWISWKLSKLVIKASATMLILAAMGAAIWWFFLRR